MLRSSFGIGSRRSGDAVSSFELHLLFSGRSLWMRRLADQVQGASTQEGWLLPLVCRKDSPMSGLYRVPVCNGHGVAQRNGTGLSPRQVMQKPPHRRRQQPLPRRTPLARGPEPPSDAQLGAPAGLPPSVPQGADAGQSCVDLGARLCKAARRVGRVQWTQMKRLPEKAYRGLQSCWPCSRINRVGRTCNLDMKSVPVCCPGSL